MRCGTASASVAVSLVGSGLRLPTVAFVGWFGPRGLASIVFALIAVESLHEEPEVATLLSVIATTVVLSVAHGPRRPRPTVTERG